MTYSKAKKTKETPVWLKFSEKDTEAIVVKLAKQGLTSEKIGLELRDTYGIPTTRITGKKIGQILRENGLYQDTTAVNLEKKHQAIAEHLKKNKQDKRAKLALTIISARISKYKKYKKGKNAEENPTDSKGIPKAD
ncbi:hypothetical protein A3K73_08905 [Candidatus Pacearchaeota archaeon RBG_13_36_9]|nr:MAG: hypothetical protein A3K73_08905 [Candidatus Pacearchaeota archaeon RBG_13_36_9]HJX50361.1 30S ribosomal protein S15 [Candidatus Nanoarchaeia archaeon]